MKLVPDEVEWHIKFVEKDSKDEADYIAEIIEKMEDINRTNYKSVLDVACGHGRLHPFLRKRGFEVSGIDISKDLISRAKIRYRRHSDSYHIADMRKFNLGIKFDVVLSWFTSFGYFNDKWNMRTLKNMSNHLRKGGLLVMAIPNAKARIEQLKKCSSYVMRQGDFLEIEYPKIEDKGKEAYWVFEDHFYKIMGRDLRFVKTYKRKVRIYTPKEIKKMFNESGLHTQYIMKKMTFDELKESDNNMVVVARKIS